MKTTMMIEGMACGHCTARVEKSLNELEGVISAVASVADKNAVVEYDETKVTEADLVEAVECLGFDVVG